MFIKDNIEYKAENIKCENCTKLIYLTGLNCHFCNKQETYINDLNSSCNYYHPTY